MIKKLCAIVVLLAASTAPAHAAYSFVEDLNLNFGNGYEETGDLGVFVGKFTNVNQFPTLSLNGNVIPVIDFSDGEPGKLFQIGTNGGELDFPNFPSSIIAEYTFNGVPAVSGDVSLVSESLPLPDALPMFGIALLALTGFAWMRRSAVKRIV